MSDAEQQYMETSENGHEVDDDFNGAGQLDDGGAELDCGEEAGDDSQNGGTDGGQIDASKGEDDAG